MDCNGGCTGKCVVNGQGARITRAGGVFSARHALTPTSPQSIKAEVGEEGLRPFIDFVLRYVADLDIPVKR